jgi:hypothetical protein
VQRAELDAHDEHDGVGVGLAELLRRAQRRHRGVAAHEPEVVALHRRPEAQVAHEHEVGSGCVEPGARHRHDMGDVGCLDAGRRVDRRAARLDVELRRLGGVDLVARLRSGQQQLAVHLVEEDRLAIAFVERELLEHGVPALDARHVERRRDDALREPVEPGLRREHVAHLRLRQDRRRHHRRQPAQ